MTDTFDPNDPVTWHGEVEPTPFERFVASLPADLRDALSEKKLRDEFERGEKQARDEKEQAALKVVKDRALHAARLAAGLVPEQTEEERRWEMLGDTLVQHTVDIPPDGKFGELFANGHLIDGKLYEAGKTYTMSLRMARDFAEREFRAYEHVRTFKGDTTWERRATMGRMRRIDPRYHINLAPNGTLA